MVRIIALFVLTLVLPACAISPPSSLFASLANDDDKAIESARSEASSPPQRKQEAGLGSSISSVWDSVKSRLSFAGKSKDSVSRHSGGEVVALKPNEAQQLVNAYRKEKGLQPLRLNAKLTEAAFAHSQDLARNDRISHYGSDGSDTWDRIKRTGYAARVTAENVGTGQLALEEVFHGWQKSPKHDANLLLSDAEEMGIAMVHDPKTQFKTFWTLVLGSPDPGAVAFKSAAKSASRDLN